MNAVEKLEGAIKRLSNIKSILGLVDVGADPAELYARVETDDSEYGDPTVYGLSLRGVDSDAEINEAFVTLNRTVDAQLAVLGDFLDTLKEMVRPWEPPEGNPTMSLVDAILGDNA